MVINMAQFRFGSFDFPDEYVKWGGVSAAPNQRQDMDSYTDGYGVTQRNALAHTKSQIDFTTLPMSGEKLRGIMQGMVSNYINYNERDANCRYYDDENGAFKTGHFYLDPSFKFKRDEVDGNGIPTKYGEMQWTFIEY